MIITDENKEIIINSGAFEYKPEVIASLLQVDVKIIEDEFKGKSEFKTLYEFGRNMAKYKIDLKLFEMAKNGDVKAMQQFEINKMINNGEA
jgi:hypothetical protein